jgi:hypothetical protein
VPTREIAEIIGRHLGVPAVSIEREDAAGHFGWIGMSFGVDAPASSALTQERLGWRPTHPRLGWRPTHPRLVEDFEAGHHFREAARV